MSGKQEGIQRDHRQTFRLEVVKRVVRISILFREVSYWTLWRGRPPLKQKKRLLVAEELEM
jgi:hypothetical protein